MIESKSPIKSQMKVIDKNTLTKEEKERLVLHNEPKLERFSVTYSTDIYEEYLEFIKLIDKFTK